MQKVINVNYNYDDESGGGTTIDDVNELLKKGWRVVLMQSFSQSVSITGDRFKDLKGKYGMTFVLEIEDGLFKDQEDFEDDEDDEDY